MLSFSSEFKICNLQKSKTKQQKQPVRHQTEFSDCSFGGWLSRPRSWETKDLRASNKSIETLFPLGHSATWGVKRSKAMSTWKSGAVDRSWPAIILSACLLNTAYQICLGLFSNSSSYGDTDANDTIFSELQRQRASGHHLWSTCHTACTTHTTQTCYWWPLTALPFARLGVAAEGDRAVNKTCRGNVTY